MILEPRAGMAGRAVAGFTLLELLVVLVIAAIAATAVGVGGQSFMERSRYHQTVREIASQLRQARALSMQEGRSVAVVYLPELRRLLVDGKPQVEIPPSVQVQWQAVERDPQSGSGSELPIFVFNADGGARGGRLAILRGGQGVAYRINWLLGTVEQAAAATQS